MKARARDKEIRRQTRLPKEPDRREADQLTTAASSTAADPIQSPHREANWVPYLNVRRIRCTTTRIAAAAIADLRGLGITQPLSGSAFFESFGGGNRAYSVYIRASASQTRTPCVVSQFERALKGHGFRACGKTHECADHRGRAALQGRVSPVKSGRALALVVALSRPIAFFRSLFSRAVIAANQSRL